MFLNNYILNLRHSPSFRESIDKHFIKIDPVVPEINTTTPQTYKFFSFIIYYIRVGIDV